MKKLFIAAALCFGAFTASAQTKGMSTLGLGLSFNSNNNVDFTNTYRNESKTNAYSIGYGYFFKDNHKLSADFTFQEFKNSNTGGGSDYTQEQKIYGGAVTYQWYYPLVKNLYAFAGGRLGYSRIDGEERRNDTFNPTTDISGNLYNAGAIGGVSWFFSKRFALETTILSADATYVKNENRNTYSTVGLNNTTTSKNFNLNTGGVFNNLGFKIYLLF